MERCCRGQQTILVVDDEPSLQVVLEQMLTQAGYRVLVAANGEEALKLHQEEGSAVSLVLLDMMMPDMCGTECLESLLERDPCLKIIICTGRAEGGEVNEALEKGAAVCLEKPITMAQLESAVRCALAGG